MRKSRLFSLLICLILLTNLAVFAMADEATEPKLTVHILETGTKNGIKNAQVNIYQVAEIVNNEYVLTEKFADCGFDVGTIGSLTADQNKTAAAKIASFVTTKKIGFTKAKITNSSGVVNITDIPLGLYLVTEPVTPSDHKAISPFLITIPQVDADGKYVYQVDAAPKTDTSDPTKPSTSPTSTTTSGGGGGKLPQTGQLWWPVYLMTALGLSLTLYGWLQKKESTHG